MDWLAFFAAAIENLAWPATVLIAIFILRSPIRSTIKNVKSFKFRDAELTFRDKLEDVVEEIEHIPSPPLSDRAKIVPIELEIDPDQIPSLSIIQAWRPIESELTELGKLVNIVDRSGTMSLVGILMKEQLIDAPTAKAISDLRQLRNLAAHTATPGAISESDAKEYLSTAVTLAEHLRWIRTRLSASKNL